MTEREISPGWVLVRCDRCGMQECARRLSDELTAFVELHRCNGQQHVAMGAIAAIVLERRVGRDYNR